MAVFQPFRPAYLADPYPFLRRLREEEPVHRSRDFDAWVLTRHADALQVFTDEKHFSSDPTTSRGEMGEQVRKTRATAPLGDAPLLGNSDPPDHTRLRAIVNRAFTPRTVEAFRPDVEAMVNDLLNAIKPGAPFDFMRQFAEPLAVLSILAFIGVPPQDLNRVREWSTTIVTARSLEGANPAAFAAAARAREEFAAYLQSAPHSGVMGTLLTAASEGERISLDEMMMLLIHITTAGNGPTAFALANAVAALAQHPEQYNLLRSDPSLVPAAVEELLRFDSPVHLVNRFVREPLEFGGRRFRAGDTVFIVTAAANHDPAVFEEPERLDVTRAPGRHLAFGQGIHFCLGAPLARLELDVALRAIGKRFATVEVPPAGLERAPDLLLRGPRLMPTRWS